jgi:hypothetical protein
MQGHPAHTFPTSTEQPEGEDLERDDGGGKVGLSRGYHRP